MQIHPRWPTEPRALGAGNKTTANSLGRLANYTKYSNAPRKKQTTRRIEFAIRCYVEKTGMMHVYKLGRR